MRRWCETVGPVVFRTPSAATPPRLDKLAVVSWNLHVGAGRVDELIDRLRAGEFTSGTRVDDFVLLLQEAYRRDDAIPARLGRDLPVPNRIAASRHRGPGVDHFWRNDQLAVLYAPSMRNGIADRDREDRGNAMVSTLPLERAALIELPLEHQRRVALASTIAGITSTGTAWRLRLVDVHLDTAIALLHGGPFAARKRQADALIAGLHATADQGSTTTVVAGDFNTWGGRERALAVMKRAFPHDPAANSRPTWTGPLGIHATLDHVFTAGAGQMTVSRLPDRYGSDHFPLLVLIRF